MLRGLPFQGHEWYYCDGCANPVVGRCCGTLDPWNQNIHGNIRDAIATAHHSGFQFGFQPGYGYGGSTYNNYNEFLGTLMVIDGIHDGNVGEVMMGTAMSNRGPGYGMAGGNPIGDMMVVDGIIDGNPNEVAMGAMIGGGGYGLGGGNFATGMALGAMMADEREEREERYEERNRDDDRDYRDEDSGYEDGPADDGDYGQDGSFDDGGYNGF